MPKGRPRIGSAVESLLHAPEGTELGVLAFTPPKAQMWASEDGAVIEMDEGPPPWETHPGCDVTDARTFVEVPDHWMLRWVNTRMLDVRGWQYWQPVKASHPKVKVKVPQMVDPGNCIRRGGQNGDILAFMPREWYDKRQQEKARRSARMAQSAVDQFEETKEAFRARRFGPHIALESAHHPTHTMGEGKTIPKE